MANTGFVVNTHRFEPYKNFKFRVKWDGRYVPGIQRVSELRRTAEAIFRRDGNEPNTSRVSPGTWVFAPITLERGVTHDPSFEDWANKALQHGAGHGAEMSLKSFRKDINLQICGAIMLPARSAGSMIAPVMLQVLNLQRRDVVRQRNAKNLGIEIQPALQRALDVLGLAEAVLLAFVEHIRGGDLPGPDGVEHQLGLVGRDDLVLVALKEDQRNRDVAGLEQGRALDVPIALGGVGANQAIQIARLVFVSLLGEDLQLAQPEQAGPRLEVIAEGQGRQGGVAARAPALDGDFVLVG